MSADAPPSHPSAREAIDDNLVVAANEASLFIIKVMRGAIDATEPINKARVSLAATAVGAWSRNEQTKTNREAIRLASERWVESHGPRQIESGDDDR